MQEVQTTLTPGAFIQNRYIVEDLLGRGGFGAVYLVRDMRVRSNLFAMKEIIDPNKRDRKQFLFEGELLKQLDHPSLARVYRVFENEPEKRVYLLMDYVAGPNLEHLRQEQPRGRFSLPEVLHLMAPIMDAVSYLHNQNPPILHRDIKPSNIIVPRVGDEPVLVDFGIAKPYNPDATTTAVRRASPGYGAPEQYSKGTNTRTDIYGLGATLYALLTGEVPVDAFTRMTALGSSGKDPLEPVKSLVPAIPRHISDAIQRAMDMNNESRFATVEEFWQALNARPMRQAPTMVMARGAANGAGNETTYPEAANVGVAGLVAEPEKPIEERTTQPRMPEQSRKRLATVGAVGAAETQRPGRRPRGMLLLFLALLALLVGLASGGGLWALLANHTASTPATAHHAASPVATRPSPTATHKTSPTVTPTTKPSPTAKPTSAPAAVPPAAPTTAPTPVPTSPPAAPTPVPTSPPATPTPVPANYPYVSGQYSGTIHNTSMNESATMSLSIQQNSGNISGYFTVNQPLVGSNPFSGTVATNKNITFTVQSYRGNAPLYFWGYVQSGSMSGQYCSLDATGRCNSSAGGAGTWSVSGASLGGS